MLEFHVFLSHKSSKKRTVRALGRALAKRGLRVWLDEEQIRPGVPWLDLLEQGIKDSASVAVCVAADGLGPWQDQEMHAALRLAVTRRLRVIPVLLPGAPEMPDLPMFLGNLGWVDLRGGLDRVGLDALVWGITGERPSAPPNPRRGSATSRAQSINTDLIATYRKAHIVRYSSLMEGRRVINVEAISRLGMTTDANLELDAWTEAGSSNRIMVLGDPGSGKTILLRQLCSKLSAAGQFLPVFVNAGQLRNLAPNTREELLRFADPPVPGSDILDRNDVVVIIDGMDELVGPTSHEKIKYPDTISAIAKLIPDNCKLIVSCRSTTFESTSDIVRAALSGTSKSAQTLADSTDEAILGILGNKNIGNLAQITLAEMTKSQAHAYLADTVGERLARSHAGEYVLEHLPRVPVILRFLQLALPQLQGSAGAIDLDELYAVALQAWMRREPAFKNENIEDVWKTLQGISAFAGHTRLSELSCIDKLVHAGLVTSLPSGRYVWSHFSVDEFFFSIALFDQISSCNADMLARLDLIGWYNINRFLVPMCRRKMQESPRGLRPAPARLVTAGEYSKFLDATGWRARSRYGMHPSYIADDGTGFVSGVSGIAPERGAKPDLARDAKPVSGLSWYDAIAYCLWAGKSMPNSKQCQLNTSCETRLWYWCIDWYDEQKAHIAITTDTTGGVAGRQGGANPDFRHSRIGLATFNYG